jgi:hypothetical protein
MSTSLKSALALFIVMAGSLLAADGSSRTATVVSLILTSNTKNGCQPGQLDFVRVMPDGSTASGVFRVPEGQALIATDVDWLYVAGNPGQTEVLQVQIENLHDSSVRQTAFQSVVTLGRDGVGGATNHLSTGFMVSSEARVCVNALPGPIGWPTRLSNVVLRGLLVPAQ